MPTDRPYHEGELAVQARAGVARAAQRVARILADRIPAAALSFIARQSMVVLGSRDPNGNIWASLAYGQPGFLVAESDRQLALHHAACYTAAGDPLWSNLRTDAEVGLLLIELATRRRLRINGKMRPRADGDWRVSVEQAYANCPKYIQARGLRIRETGAAPTTPTVDQGTELTAAQQAWIAGADTFFVASAHPEQGLDASHRGGPPGFVQVIGSRWLRVPDYAGNNMFNTLGNIASHPRCGLVFADFERSRVLQLTGRAEILWDQPDERGRAGGTARFWEFEVEVWRETELGVELDWEELGASPFLPVHRNA
ncbi:MAG: pyridoxamine 5'-phosphate oxidase family protein [Myxococcales bacterium]|nr:pyridoxamine 5'-phosphate oxidase family protein [Myxococcales bacterium]